MMSTLGPGALRRWFAVWAGGALALGACDKPAPPPTATAPAAPDASPANAPDAGARAGRVTLTITEPSSATRPAPSTRCTLDGDPPMVPCVGGGALAATADGAVYLSVSDGVRRYRRRDGDGCALALDPGFGTGGILAPPADRPTPQTLGKGSVYLRSGGPDWRLTAAGDRVYLHDFLLGLYRIDGGKLAPVCPQLQGVRDLAIQGNQAITSLEGGRTLALGKKCKATPLALEPRPSFGVIGVGTQAWGKTGSGTLVRYDADGAAVATIGGSDAFAPGGLCSTVAATTCGGDVCVLDGNCQKLARFDRDGGFRLERKAEQLLGDRPYALADLAPAADDGLWILAAHRDGDTCEAAVYLVPAVAISL